jgi:DNA-binding NarL/FixJ family response regulator
MQRCCKRNVPAWGSLEARGGLHGHMLTTVFVADDHSIVRDGLVSLLRANGLEVVGTADNGRDAVNGVLRLAPRVVVMDISMPDLGGIDAAREIRAILPDVGIVILTMHSSAEYVFKALEAGVRGYLLKESASVEIIDAVRAVEQGRRYLSRKVAEIVADGIGERAGAGVLESLSKREREVLRLVVDGYSSTKIGALLHLSPKTIDSYRSRLMHKLHVNQLAGLVKFAVQHGLTASD